MGGPRLTIYRHKKTGAVLVQPYGVDPIEGGQFEWGPAVEFPPTADLEDVARAVVRTLPLSMVEGNRGLEVRRNREAMRELAANYDLVLITEERGKVRLAPFVGRGGRHVSAEKSFNVSRASMTNEKLASALARAFLVLS